MGSAKERLLQILREVSVLRGRFRLASGRESTYYVDARFTTLHPEGLSLIADLVLDEIGRLEAQVDAVGGPSIGADPIVGAVVARSWQRGAPLKGFLVRKQEKGHGTGRLIEGWLEAGRSVAVVEDVATTGGSIVRAVEAVRAAGGRVESVVVVVDRGEGAAEAVRSLGCGFASLFKVEELL